MELSLVFDGERIVMKWNSIPLAKTQIGCAKMKITTAIAALILASVAATAQANTVDVSYTTSGSAGSWTYDLSITNNIGGTNDIYAVQVQLSTGTLAGSPPGWAQGFFAPIEWCYAGNCGYFGATNLAPAQTLSGFLVSDTATTAASSLLWRVFAEGGTYFGPGNITGNPSNPGFSGTAAATPLPAALPLFAGGLGLIGLLAKRRKSKPAIGM
jgi:hypothetical protein